MRLTANLMMEHKTRSVDDSLVGANANDFWRHDVFDSHCPILNLKLAEKASALYRMHYAPEG